MSTYRPDHYIINSVNIQLIDIFPFLKSGCASNFLKYAVRYKDKGNPTDDLRKAIVYYNTMVFYNDYPDEYGKPLVAMFLNKLSTQNPILSVPDIFNKSCREMLDRIYENIIDTLTYIENESKENSSEGNRAI